ncbi:UNC-50-like protein [Dacryopinax primogenitus]|uniref:UNC-50-like protein n=1 Tax=Dacryopinax primogenitus (strain DJM 731) TaxID=1858805 RepID=M5FTC6_DACPD|nr:UNC-50-like protein [Dacryopinax primogenitus]EJT99298.1 UNC-50-like protein [Dacryopinax primogenitus]
MPILPVLSSGSRVLTGGSDAGAGWTRLPPMFRRMLRFQHMDFELALWQLTYLCIAPRKVYKQVYYHKQTHNTWARNDPAMLILISASLACGCITWSVVYSLGPVGGIRLALVMVFRDFILTGLIVCSLLWRTAPGTVQTDPGNVEWAYAFDVHCNGFVPLFFLLYVIQLILVPVITQDKWICLLLGNLLYLIAFTQYFYITYLGYNALPFLIRTEVILLPLIPILTGFVASLLGYNIARKALTLYFGA